MMAAEPEYVVRTQRIPIAEVIDGGTRQELYRDLNSSLKRCTAAMNRCITECATIDREAYSAVAFGEKVPRCPKLYTYPVLKGLFPGGAQVASAISRAAEAHYKAFRSEIVTGARSLGSQRSCPVPLHCNKSVRNLQLTCESDENVLASFRMLIGPRYTVRLRGGGRYARQLKTVRAAALAESVGDSKVWIDRRGQIILGVACKVPVKTNRATSGVLTVSTARDAFIVATKAKTDTPFTINADHVRQWQEERNRKQKRLRQDRKSGQSRRYVNQKQADVSRKHTNRMSSFVHEAAAHIVEHARRRKVRAVQYDDTVRSFVGREFPWYDMRLKLQHKCEAQGITFELIGLDMTPAQLDEPHVYFVTPIVDGEVNGRVKIGMTSQKAGRRARSLEAAGGYELLVLATDKQPKTKLRARERHYHSQFSEHRIDGQREWFQAEPVIAWLRETGCLGNAGNITQIQQYMEA